MAGTPFRVCVSSSKHQQVQFGIVAKNLDHLKSVVQEKLGLSSTDLGVFLDDGTLICDDNYFHLLQPQTRLTVKEHWEGSFLHILIMISL